MPVYQYKGKHYELAEGLSPEQAKAKIETHLAGEQSTGLGKGALDVAGGILETGTTGALDMFGGLAAQGMAVGNALLNGKDVSQARDEMAETYADSDAHKLLAPQTKTGKWIEDKIGHAVEFYKDKAADVGPSLVNAIPFIGPELNEQNPELGHAVSAVGSAFPELLAVEGAGKAMKPFKAKQPRVKPTRGIDPNSVINAVADQDRPQLTTRKPGAQGNLFPESSEGLASPYDAGMAGVTEPIQPLRQRAQMDLPLGDGLPPVMEATRKGEVRTGAEDPGLQAAVDKFKAEQAQREFANKTNETEQFPLFDQPHEGRPPMANEAVTGDWRVDENGMPVKADLSMEAQNLQNPLQRNLFGDELPQKHPQEAPTGYMQSMADTAGALDRSRSFESFDRLKQMQEEQNALLRGEIQAPGQLEAAKLAAETMDPRVRGDNPRMGFNFKKQGGAVNMNVMKDGFQKLKQLADGTWLRAHNDGTMFHIDAMKDGHKVAHVEMAPEYIDRMSGDERNMKAYMTHVREDMRGKGYASEMYKFASELGNDVQRSESQTPMGKAMWDKFHEKGMAKKGVIPKKQMGAIDPRVLKDGVEKLYHGGREFKKWDPRTVGKGEGMGVMGPALYAADKRNLAERYVKYGDQLDFNEHGDVVTTPGVLSELAVDMKKFFDPRKTMTEAQKAAHDRAVAALDQMGLRASQRGLKSALNQAWDKEAARKAVVDAGIDGIWEDLGPDFGREIAIYNPDVIKQVSRADTPVERLKSIKSPGKKQQGAIFTRPKDENARKVLDNIPGIEKTLKGLAPSKWTPADAIDAARSAKDLTQNAVQKLSNIFTKGGQYMIDRSDNNPVIRYGVEQVQESERQTRADIANMLHDKDFGLGAVTRAMTAEEQKNIWTLMNWADLHQHELTPSLLKEHGATEAQMKYVETHRQVMDYAHEQMNKVMETLGKPPVPKRVAYAAMNASGDFRRLVYKDGDVVGIIGSDLRWKTDGLKAELEKKGYTVGEERYMGAKGRQAGDIQREFAQMLEWFAAEDPRVAQLLDTVAEVTSSMARNFMNMEVHTKAKKGIFGMDGRKAVDGMEWGGSVLTRDKQLANAREGLKAQMNYAEMAIKWGHLSEAAKNVKEVLSSPEIADKQPMAKQWTQDYLAHSMGYNPTFGRHLEEYAAKAIGATGVGYSVAREGVAVSRRVVNSVLLGLNPGFWYTNVIQPLQSMPGMRSYLVSKGLDASFDLGTGYSYVGKGGIDAFKAAYEPGKLSGDLKDAYNYARTHHVYGSDLIEHSNHIHKGFSYNAERVSSAVAGNIESSTRATMYYSFVRMLRENGMTKENGLHETAHNLTDMTMNNYSRTDRPQVYDMMGPVGETASNLASYKHNELSRVAMFAREALDGNAKPMVAQLLAGLFYTGVKGTIAYNSVDWLVKQISAFVGHPVSLTKGLMEVSQMVGGKVAPYALSHGAFSLLGIDMANRLGLGDALIPNVFPGGSKLAQIAGRAYDTIKNPNEANTKELIREASPGIATGVQDLTWFSKGDLGSRRSDLAGSVKRTKTDKIVKAIGLTGINESTEKQKLYENKWINETYTDLRKGTIDTMKGEIYMKGAPSSATIQKYLNQRGDVRGLLKEIERISKEQNMSARDRDLLRASTMKSVQAMEHMKDLQESFK